MDQIQDIYPLSPMQEGMLFHSLYRPEDGAYLIQVSCELQGALEPAIFSAAWEEVQRRHSILRTAFVWEDVNQPLQIVFANAPAEIVQHDWRTLPPAAQAAERDRLLAADRRRGFQLTSAPLMRMALMRMSEDTYSFLWSCHHIIFDGWSMPLLFKELLTCYELLRSNTRDQIDHVLGESRPYREYIEWIKRQPLGIAEASWRRWLAGFSTPTHIDLPQQRLAEHGLKSAAEQYIVLPTHTSLQLQACARQQHLTLNTLLLGAWSLLLARYSGKDDIVFGATVAGRPADLPGSQLMIGLFVNTLPLRVTIQADLPIQTWLQQIQQQQAELRHYDYSPLLEIQRWSELPRGTALFEHIFVFENFPPGNTLAEQTKSLAIHDVRILDYTHYPLVLEGVYGTELTLTMSYDRGRFDNPTVTRMLQQLRSVLEQMAANVEQPVGALSLLTEKDRQLIEAWNATFLPVPAEKCLHDLIDEQSARTPTACAVQDHSHALTYAQLDARANQLAHQLQALGVGPEVCVGVCLPRTTDLLIAVLAILKAGGAYVPLDPAYPSERLTFLVQDAHLRVIVTTASLREQLPASARALEYLDLLQNDLAAYATTPPVTDVLPDNLAYLIYTSGSTGTPKGVAITHRNAVAFVAWAQMIFGPEELAGVLAATSLSFDLSLFELFVPLSVGGQVILTDTLLHLPTLPMASQITLVNTVPSVLAEFLRAASLPSGVRTVNLAGEALPAALVEHVYALPSVQRVYNLYGPSETTTYSTWALIPQGCAQPPIGQPIGNMQVYLLDQALQLVPIGVPGEVYLGGPGLARGYFQRPQLTAAQFIPHPYTRTPGERLYRTGDLARYRPDGQLEYLGRKDQQVKLRGFRIELGEIEAVLQRHPAVAEAVVAAREDEMDAGPGEHPTQRLVAYIVRKEQTAADASPASVLNSADLRAYVGSHLPEYMVPSVIMTLDTLPLTPTGKLDRRALPAPDRQRPDLVTSFVPPQTDLEQTIAQLWQAVLNVEHVGIHDNFFDLGGHSLTAVRMHSQLQASLSRPFALTSVFEYPTIHALANFLQRKPVETVAQATEHIGRDRADTRRQRLQQRPQFRPQRRGGSQEQGVEHE